MNQHKIFLGNFSIIYLSIYENSILHIKKKLKDPFIYPPSIHPPAQITPYGRTSQSYRWTTKGECKDIRKFGKNSLNVQKAYPRSGNEPFNCNLFYLQVPNLSEILNMQENCQENFSLYYTYLFVYR